MTTATVTWEQVGDPAVWVRREGDRLTFLTHNSLPLLPCWIEVEGRAIAKRLYLDTGTIATFVARSVVEAAGIVVDDLPAEGFTTQHNGSEGWIRPTSHRCPGRILLWDGTPLLEDGFMVPSIEPAPELHSYGAASLLGLDAIEGFRVGLDYTRAPRDRSTLYDPMEHDPVFSLTPRS